MVERLKGDSLWRERAARLFCLLAAAGTVYFLLKAAALPLAVLGISLGIGWGMDRLSGLICRRLRLPRGVLAALLCVSFWLTLGAFLVWLLWTVASELSSAALYLSENGDAIEASLSAVLSRLEELIDLLPFSDGGSEGEGWLGALLGEGVSEAVRSLGGNLLGAVGGSLGSALRRTPDALIALVVCVVGSVYWSVGFDSAMACLRRLLPPRAEKRLNDLAARGGRALKGYLRAYVLLFLMTFLEVFLGLRLLDQPYALLLALLVAAVDILPILGSGTVLIPWAVVMLFLRDLPMGLGLLILYGVITVIRQIVEPHVVGNSMGVPPPVTLFFSFFGLHLFGVLGLLLAPFVALMVKHLLASY